MEADQRVLPITPEAIEALDRWKALIIVASALRAIPDFVRLWRPAYDQLAAALEEARPDVMRRWTNLSPEARGAAMAFGSPSFLAQPDQAQLDGAAYRAEADQLFDAHAGAAFESYRSRIDELLDASEKQEVRRRAAELKQVERRLAEVEADFAKNLALLKRDVLDEGEFRTANEARRDERARLTGRQTELTAWLEQQHQRQEAVGTLPTRVRSFLKDVQALDTRRAKALLQTILSAAHVYRDGRIELEFRGQHT